MTANNDKLLFALGLCRRSGALTCGTPLICTALRQKGKEKPLLVLVASDASEATRKKLTDKCAFYEVPLWPLAFSGETLASAVGKKGMLAAVAIAGENPAANGRVIGETNVCYQQLYAFLVPIAVDLRSKGHIDPVAGM